MALCLKASDRKIVTRPQGWLSHPPRAVACDTTRNEEPWHRGDACNPWNDKWKGRSKDYVRSA
jgi:hypothetical protein